MHANLKMMLERTEIHRCCRMVTGRTTEYPGGKLPMDVPKQCRKPVPEDYAARIAKWYQPVDDATG